MSLITMWVDCEGIMLSEIKEKRQILYDTHIWNKKAEFIETKTRMLVIWYWDWGKWGELGQRVQTSHVIFFFCKASSLVLKQINFLKYILLEILYKSHYLIKHQRQTQ